MKFYNFLFFIIIGNFSLPFLMTSAVSLSLTDFMTTQNDPMVLQTNYNNLTSTDNSTVLPAEEEDAVSETLRILAVGDQEIILNDGDRDIVLVLGNTGAGKSTMTQLLAGNNTNLFSYEAEDGHLLIRDTENRISFGTTLVSKSIYPELFIHGPTGTAFYDCPGFSDTRNASVEIANAFFIKKVADHAHRLKLLFIVNHSSVKSGQSRTDFKTLMEQSTNLIKNPLKFRNGTALIVTKVESHRNTESLVNGVARFLAGAKHDLSQLITDNHQLQQSQDLIDSFLEQNGDQHFDKIGLFRQPQEIGELSQMEIVQESKKGLEKIIFNHTQFVQKNLNDFRISVSHSAQLLVSNLGKKLNHRLSLLVSDLCQNFENQFQMIQVGQDPMTTRKIDILAELESEIQFFQNLITSLSQNGDPNHFFQTILLTFKTRKEDPKIKNILENILLDVQKLNFLDQLNHGGHNQIPPSHAEWLQPFSKAMEKLTREFTNFQSSINSQVTMATVQIGGVMKQNFEHFLSNQQLTGIYQMRQDFQILNQKMTTLLTTLRTCSDLTCFLNHVTTTIQSMGMATPMELEKITSKNDTSSLTILLKSPYKPDDWLQAFEKISKFLEDQNFILARRTNDEIQNCLNNFGTILTSHFNNLESQFTSASDRLSRFSGDSLIILSMVESLKESKFFKEFLLEIETGCRNLDMAIPPDFKILLDFYKNNENGNIDLFQPIFSKASPLKPFEWIRPLELLVSQFLHKKMADLTKVIEEEKRLEAEKVMQEQIRKMNEEAERLRAAQEAAAKKVEEERLERTRLENEREEKERQEEIRRAAQKAEEERLAREREANALAAQQAREQALREQMAQIQRELDRARAERPKKRKWWRG